MNYFLGSKDKPAVPMNKVLQAAGLLNMS